MHVLDVLVLTGELGASRRGVFWIQVPQTGNTHDLLLLGGRVGLLKLLGSSSEVSCPSSDGSMLIASVLGLISSTCLSGFGSSLSRGSSALLPASSSSTLGRKISQPEQTSQTHSSTGPGWAKSPSRPTSRPPRTGTSPASRAREHGRRCKTPEPRLDRAGYAPHVEHDHILIGRACERLREICGRGRRETCSRSLYVPGAVSKMDAALRARSTACWRKSSSVAP